MNTQSYDQIYFKCLAIVNQNEEEISFWGNETSASYFLHYSHYSCYAVGEFEIPTADSAMSRDNEITLHLSKEDLKKYDATLKRRPATGFILFRRQISRIFRSWNLSYSWERVSYISACLWDMLVACKAELINIIKRVYDAALWTHNINMPFALYDPNAKKEKKRQRGPKTNDTKRKRAPAHRPCVANSSEQLVYNNVPIPWNLIEVPPTFFSG
ncbi:14664_t:CDS:1 [Acaulospora morrowiae]|uniref:14664_t:CDS:1 n=1 Tax=Acaulospora morrowiae TaxID=94023 RepID=A0A9N8WNT4_9GLOM|nr:14664_t:CDS:1 [Acaulospora morrowiae]